MLQRQHRQRDSFRKSVAGLITGLVVAITIGAFLPGAAAQEAADPDITATTTAVQAAEPSIDTGDNAWMLVSAALVLMMTGPGLALFYGGLVRKKNVLSILMQCIFLMGLMTVLWGVYGYSLSFATNGIEVLNPFIGGTDYLFMRGVQPTYGEPLPVVESMPRLTHMLFQGMFFIITPALICGAFAERMKFSTMVVFSILWGTFVYCPLCHMVWGGGLLAYDNPYSTATGALDFAGGTVVHISSGASALVCALLIGKRLGHGSEPMPPHNLTYTAVGAAMLWVGWFGFNGGSALAADGIAASAFCATHFGAAAGALAWSAVEWFKRGKPSLLGACSGAVAGLVCVTPAAGFVQPMSAILMGLAAGVVCYYACTTLKNRFDYDDSLDAFGVHGVGGTLGAVLTGVFATRAVWDIGGGAKLGLIEGGGVIVPQVLAALITWVLSVVATFVLLKLLDASMGLRVSQEAEIAGLDFSEHNEEGYIFI